MRAARRTGSRGSSCRPPLASAAMSPPAAPAGRCRGAIAQASGLPSRAGGRAGSRRPRAPASTLQQAVDRRDDRHRDPVPRGELGQHRRGVRAFGDGAAIRHQLAAGRLPFAERLAEREVAARGRGAGQHQVAEPAQSGERVALGPRAPRRSASSRHSRARSAPRGRSGRGRALDHAAGDREHVLDRAADLGADDVLGVVRAEVRAGRWRRTGAPTAGARRRRRA